MKIPSEKSQNHESGVAILESLIAIILMGLIFFGCMQLFHWAMSKMVGEYSAFYGAKATALGYANRTISKAGRAAAMGISGQDYSTPKMNIKNLSRSAMLDKVQLYMSTGNGGVSFAYWDPPRGSDPELKVSPSSMAGRNWCGATVTLENAPMLSGNVANFLRIGTDEADIKSSVRTYDFSENYLKD